MIRHLLAAAFAVAAGSAQAITVEFSFTGEDGSAGAGQTAVGTFEIADDFDFTVATGFVPLNITILSGGDPMYSRYSTARCLQNCRVSADLTGEPFSDDLLELAVPDTFPTADPTQVVLSDWVPWTACKIDGLTHAPHRGTGYRPETGFFLASGSLYQTNGGYLQLGAGGGLGSQKRARYDPDGVAHVETRPCSRSGGFLGVSLGSIVDSDSSSLTFRVLDGADVSAEVPLPAGLPLLLAGLGALAFTRRRAA